VNLNALAQNFISPSIGRRTDTLRHMNCNLSNEQIVTATQVNWWESTYELQRSDDSMQNCLVYIIDDFIGTGTSLLDMTKRKMERKMKRFFQSVEIASKKCIIRK
jgi:hypothetical protein